MIDEAGQISLADALAMGTCARNVILLGDPQQLAQVSQAVHPPGAGVSVLEHLLGEHTTIPPERGLFIDETRRMHPDVCRFISKAIYEDRLESFADCADQRIEAPGRADRHRHQVRPRRPRGQHARVPGGGGGDQGPDRRPAEGAVLPDGRNQRPARPRGDHGRRPVQRAGALPARGTPRRGAGSAPSTSSRARRRRCASFRWRRRAARRSPATWSSCSVGIG